MEYRVPDLAQLLPLASAGEQTGGTYRLLEAAGR